MDKNSSENYLEPRVSCHYRVGYPDRYKSENYRYSRLGSRFVLCFGVIIVRHFTLFLSMRYSLFSNVLL